MCLRVPTSVKHHQLALSLLSGSCVANGCGRAIKQTIGKTTPCHNAAIAPIRLKRRTRRIATRKRNEKKKNLLLAYTMVIDQAIPWWVIAGPTFDVVVFLDMEKKKKKTLRSPVPEITFSTSLPLNDRKKPRCSRIIKDINAQGRPSRQQSKKKKKNSIQEWFATTRDRTTTPPSTPSSPYSDNYPG